MKKIFLLLAIPFFAIKGIGQQKNFNDLIGRWEIIGEQSAGACLEIIDSVNMILIYSGEKKKILDCKFDFAKSPIWFDFSAEDSTSSIVIVKSLIEIMNNNMIKWQLFIDGDRTDHFSSAKGELFYLRKAKPGISTARINN